MNSNFSSHCSLKGAKVKDFQITYYPSVNYLEPEDIILRKDSRNHFMHHGGNVTSERITLSWQLTNLFHLPTPKS